MDNNMLSQDEIDALLKNVDLPPANEQENNQIALSDYLSTIEQDAIGEIGNISFGSSATALSTLLNQKVEITTPLVSVVQKSNLAKEFPHPYVAIDVKYTKGFTGNNLLVIQQNDAAIIADLMLGGDGKNVSNQLGELQISAVQEAMNQMMGSAATSMSTVFNKKVDISPPKIELLDVKEGEGTDSIPHEDLLIKVSFKLIIGDLINSHIMQLLPIDFAKELIDDLLNKSEGEIKSAPATKEDQVHPSKEKQPVSNATHVENEKDESVEVKTVDFTSFDSPSQEQATNDINNLNMLLDIPLKVSVELGRTKRSVKEILSWSSGSIIELDKLAGEPVDILVNDKIVAKGEVVVIDENFGVRVTDILSHSERIKNLNE
ncbi:flagellar motor switch phosphatase FliY [Bacillus carboniphilus]|uniref:Flagellar motor switch protein FliN n=1 Tax=Bacillus carboniphilus TaxID=86663 RepID=A0ABY9K0V8_9BACI|nr:flagellar motor switch phosphatase FliY [Bacillus carboniphilus]WLR43531.1 flagellar motor switch phosphatase FliY [Bacillus carboniphilus]